MARPPAKELTERELEVMQVFWERTAASPRRGSRTGPGGCGVRASGGGAPGAEPTGITAAEVRDALAAAGLDRAYTTIATLVRILLDKRFIEQLPGDERPYRYRAARSYEDVSGRLLGDLVERVFGGSREKLLVRLLGNQKLTTQERSMLEQLLREDQP